MRETRFIDQNTEKWREFEQSLFNDEGDPEKLRERFTQITEDFSYARTFYPNRMVRLFLNGLAQAYFHKINTRRRASMGRFWRFWTHEIPQIVWESRGSFATAFGVFMLAFAVGVISCRIDPDFPRRILGDSYVDMTIANIESGDPMKVYKESGAFGMSLGIAANNLFVALLTFTFGASWGLGTLFFLLFNGIMVGAFQWFFIEKGVGLESFLTIWTHGALEISAIVIAGAAGFELARGLVFPGTLTRGQAFRISAGRGLKIFISITPVLLLAAFFEGFLTRHTELPNLQRGIFIAICFLFIAIYFVWLPWIRAQRGEFSKPLAALALAPTDHRPVVFDSLRTSGEILADSIILMKKHAGFLTKTVVISAALSWLFMFLMFDGDRSLMFEFSDYRLGVWANTAQFFANENIHFLWVFQGFMLSVLTSVVFHFLKKEKSKTGELPVNETYFPYFLREFIFSAAIMLPVSWMLGHFGSVGSRVFFMPVFFMAGLAVAAIFFEPVSPVGGKTNPFSAIYRALTLASADFLKGALLNLIWIFIGAMCYLFVSSMVFRQIFELVVWNLSIPPGETGIWIPQLQAICSLSILFGIFTLAMFGCGLLFHALREIREATSLHEKLDEIGTGRAIRGLARE